MQSIIPTKAEREEALKNPNGWVYVINSAYADKLEVPPNAIKGAWKVNSLGEIEGQFIPNPNYDIED